MTYITIQEEVNSWWRGLLQPSVLNLMAYVESLAGLEFTTFHYVQCTDELDVKGTFQGYRINICMEWGGKISLTCDSDLPVPLVSALEKHLSSYKYVGARAGSLAAERFKRLAKHGN
ncbi:hypothetical protein [Alteromonas sp. D210916BOD_24]|uniref:hypothetical protein n=1 Tax=Alteromonas sp. D210916BOD_24 TaxID=3157618 RepID=UPI00399D1296